MRPDAVGAIAIVVKVRAPGVKGITVVQAMHEVCESVESVEVQQTGRRDIGSHLTELELVQAVHLPRPPLSLCASSRLRSKRPARSDWAPHCAL